MEAAQAAQSVKSPVRQRRSRRDISSWRCFSKPCSSRPRSCSSRAHSSHCEISASAPRADRSAPRHGPAYDPPVEAAHLIGKRDRPSSRRAARPDVMAARPAPRPGRLRAPRHEPGCRWGLTSMTSRSERHSTASTGRAGRPSLSATAVRKADPSAAHSEAARATPASSQTPRGRLHVICFLANQSTNSFGLKSQTVFLKFFVVTFSTKHQRSKDLNRWIWNRSIVR